MCLTVPSKISAIKNNKAKVLNSQNNAYEVDISLIKNLKKGDWVLANANIALKKISAKEAKEILNFLNIKLNTKI